MTDDAWGPLRLLVGNWTGTGEGESGLSTVARAYQFVLGDRFLEARNRSVYALQEKNPKGETHEDLGLFSYDKARGQFVLRQFHVEGFVNQYLGGKPSAEGEPLCLTTEAIENIAAGWQARETYTVLGPDEFVEVFELAPPDGEFALYSESHLKRISVPGNLSHLG
ncbi:MAG: hypothetical protein ABI847_11375 [Anaerolineales bacterium]